MSTINLIIGGVDISEYVETESYSVRKVQKVASEFTRYDGSDVMKRSGYYYELSVNFEDIHNAVILSLISALDSDKIEITFTDPHSADCTTASFQRGESTGGEISKELDDGLYWNLGISVKSEIIPAEGCL